MLNSSCAIPFKLIRGKPVDLSFKNIKTLSNWTLLNFNDCPSSFRMMGLPNKGKYNNRYESASLLLNDNQLTDSGLSGIRSVVHKLLVQPDALLWLDLSRNLLTDVADDLTDFPNLRTLYLHDNAVESLCAAGKLKKLSALRSVTLQGNPMAAVKGYRTTVMRLLPQLATLDFVKITNAERKQLAPAPVEHVLKTKMTITR